MKQLNLSIRSDELILAQSVKVQQFKSLPLDLAQLYVLKSGGKVENQSLLSYAAVCQASDHKRYA